MKRTVLSMAAASLILGAVFPETGVSSDLPEITCDTRDCWVVRPGAFTGARAPSPVPLEAAPPAGQRLLWQGGGYPNCQTIQGLTSASALEYIAGAGVDVPLGSSHASLDVTLETKQNVTLGSVGAFGRLQIRRTGATNWYNASFGYAQTTLESTRGNQYSAAPYIGLVDLADLPDGTGIPTQIDVRMILWETKTSGAVSTANEVCKGLLRLAF